MSNYTIAYYVRLTALNTAYFINCKCLLFIIAAVKWLPTKKHDFMRVFFRPQVDFECNRNCTCDVTVFTPVCGDDGLNYFSPCFAGCTGEVITDGTEKVKTYPDTDKPFRPPASCDTEARAHSGYKIASI